MSTRRGGAVAESRTSFRITARGAAFAALLLAYVLVTVGVLLPTSPILHLDLNILHIHVQGHHPQYKPFIKKYVMFGQRGPATLIFLPFFFWVAWRARSTRPLVMLVAALILLNVSVGVVKYATGRVGPAHINDVHMIFAGGNIYPSGHVSNAVVLYGLVAWLTPRFRKTVIGLAVFLCLSIGLCTVYLRTHWFSDVLGGWMAGGLVLLALPSAMPLAQRWADAVVAWTLARLPFRRGRAVPAAHRRADDQPDLSPVEARPEATGAPVRSQRRPAANPATRTGNRLATVPSRETDDSPT